MITRNRAMEGAFLSTAIIALAGSAIAQDMKMIPANEPLKWVNSSALPKGAQGVVLVGDLTKSGEIVVVRSKFPPNYLAPPHTHPFTETITVISGEVGLGMDEKVTKTGQMAKPGAFFSIPQATPTMSGPETRKRSSKFNTPGQEGLPTSTRRTIRARSKLSS